MAKRARNPESLRKCEQSGNDHVRLLRCVLDAHTLPFCQVNSVESFQRVFAAFAHFILPVVRSIENPLPGCHGSRNRWELHIC